MKKSLTALAYMAFVLMMVPSTANADVFSPMLWATHYHLVIGNLYLGLIEGFLILFITKSRVNPKSLRRRIAVPVIMILANYVSAGIGYLIINSGAGRLINGSIINVNSSDNAFWVYMSAVIFTFFAVTILIEWPFCLWALKALRYKGRLSLAALNISIIAQIVSYTLLIILLYSRISDTSIITGTDADPSLSFVKNPHAEVCFISEPDGDVYKIYSNGKDKKKVFDVDTVDPSQPQYLWNAGEGKSWELKIGSVSKEDKELDQLFFGGRATDLRLPGKRNLKVTTTDIFNCLDVMNRAISRRSLSVGMYTPIISWVPECATALPGDQVIYQLNNQIVILDIHSRKVGLITYGRSPVVKLEEETK